MTGVSFGEFGLNIESHWGLSKSISLSLKGQTDPGRRWKAVFENRNWDLQLIQINFPEQSIQALSRQRKEVSGARYYYLLLTFVLSDKKIISCFVTESPQISQLFLHTPNAHSYYWEHLLKLRMWKHVSKEKGLFCKRRRLVPRFNEESLKSETHLYCMVDKPS